ncbi:MAG: CDP-diacylglycerol--glycerol-3-phosphate 3-phosphatidyltransferase [Candidatus Woesearchaeota archaeon]
MKKFIRNNLNGENSRKISNLANKITITRILLIPVFILCLVLDFKYNNYYAALMFAILSFSDLIDGYIARKNNEVTKFGSLIDPLADKLLVSAALIFLIGRGVDAWMAYVIIAREFIISGVRMLALIQNRVISAKFSGKLKTLIQLVAILFVILVIPYASIIMLVATLITIYSGIEYLWIERDLFKGVF